MIESDYDDTLQALDFDESEIEQVDSEQEAESLGDLYAPIAISGYVFESQGYQASQDYLDKFYDDLTVDKELSTRENVVIRNEKGNDTLISVPGTTGVADGISTWVDIMSESQSSLLNLIPGGSASQFTLGVTKEFTGRMTFDKRVQTTKDTIDKVNEKYGESDILLTGHSLGGAVTRKVALEEDLSSIIYNSAVGKHSIYKNNQRKNVELRIKKDVVSMTVFQKPREYSFDRGYSMLKTLKAHDLENFIKDRGRYNDILDGKLRLTKYHPLDQKQFKMSPPTKYKTPDVFTDFYDRRCPTGFRFNPRTDRCEGY